MVTEQLCECGCGRPAPIAKMTRKERGQVRGEPIRFISGHNAAVRVATEETRRKLSAAKLGKQLPLKISPEERFWSKVDQGDANACWIYKGKINNKGYGMFTVRGKHVLAHRFSYALTKGPIPEGLSLDHLCKTTRCVNPGHLEAVTQRVNVYRGNGFSSSNKSKTHCPRGHAYTPENTIIREPDGWRQCRECTREKDRQRIRNRRTPWDRTTASAPAS